MPSSRAPSIPVGRIRRGVKVGGLLGVETARRYATRVANVTRPEEDRRAADERRRLEAADHAVEVLGQMKGAAMKVGQLAALMDFNRLSNEGRGEFQAKLARLNDSAPEASFKEMRKVIEHDLGDRISTLFSEFDTEAAAAASIGQVFRARLRDGREVAVKVQYPRVAAAVHADLQNLGLLMLMAKHFAPGLDAKSTALEVRERVTEELDYEHEAQAQRMFARRWHGHPFVAIPDVVTDLCRERVLVTEWMDGTSFERLKIAPEATRDRVGEIVFRFFFGSLYRFGHFSGDPHPGNFLLLRDGRVAFLDFGMTKTLPRATIELELGVLRAALDGDAARAHAGLASLKFFKPDDPRFDPERVLAHVRALNAWYANDEPFTITPGYVSRLMVDAGDPRSEYWDLMRNETVPADSLFSNRMQAMTLAVIGQLNATANWHRVMSEWIYGARPSSPLGVAEAEFFGARPVSTERAA
jgi:predicted unusual protein kinase regulating ubiquinone biosynthesis (AarF/ABC1/UbiB family)